MSEPDNEMLSKLDALVSAHLADQAAQVDASAGLQRVRAGMGETRARRRPWFRFALVATAAAAVLVAFLGGRYAGPGQANAHELVQEVKHVHGLPLERCYLVEMRRVNEEEAEGKAPRRVRVWTAGDRFWAETQHAAAPPFVWGRTENGALWAVLDSQRGVRVSAEQAPKPLTVLADVYGLNVETLLTNVLQDCTLAESPAQTSKLTRVITADATADRTRMWLDKAILEIDTETKVLRRLIVHRNRLGVPYAQVTFTLVETQPRDAGKYQLEGHLRPPFRIHEGNIPPRVKLELVGRWLGLDGGKKNVRTEIQESSTKFADCDGRMHTPLAQKGMKATVLLFVLPDCPISNAYAPEIKRLCADYEAKKIAFFVVHADPDVSAEQAKKHAAEYGLPCPVLRDSKHVLVKHAGVTIAPEVAVIGPDQNVLYRGRIDDWYVDYGKRRAEPTRRDLRLALDAILRGDAIANPMTEAIGCFLPEPLK